MATKPTPAKKTPLTSNRRQSSNQKAEGKQEEKPPKKVVVKKKKAKVKKDATQTKPVKKKQTATRKKGATKMSETKFKVSDMSLADQMQQGLHKRELSAIAGMVDEFGELREKATVTVAEITDQRQKIARLEEQINALNQEREAKIAAELADKKAAEDLRAAEEAERIRKQKEWEDGADQRKKDAEAFEASEKVRREKEAEEEQLAQERLKAEEDAVGSDILLAANVGKKLEENTASRDRLAQTLEKLASVSPVARALIPATQPPSPPAEAPPATN